MFAALSESLVSTACFPLVEKRTYGNVHNYVVLCSNDMVKAHMVSEFFVICLVVFA